MRFYRRHPYLYHFTKYRIAKVALAVVEKSVIRDVNKELAGGAVFICGARHRDRAASITQTVVGFILNRRIRFLLLHLLVKTTALNHEAENNAVKRSVVIETTVDVIDKVFTETGAFWLFSSSSIFPAEVVNST